MLAISGRWGGLTRRRRRVACSVYLNCILGHIAQLILRGWITKGDFRLMVQVGGDVGWCLQMGTGKLR